MVKMEVQHGVYQENIFNLFSSIRETYKLRVEETLQNLERHFLAMLEDILTDAEKRLVNCASLVKEVGMYEENSSEFVKAEEQATSEAKDEEECEQLDIGEGFVEEEEEEKDVIEDWFTADVLPTFPPMCPPLPPPPPPETEHLKREPIEASDLPAPSSSSISVLEAPITLPPDQNWNQCPKCDRKFRQYSKLKMHIAARHSGRNPFQCNICMKGFSRNDSLLRHIRTKHHRLLSCSVSELQRFQPNPTPRPGELN